MPWNRSKGRNRDRRTNHGLRTEAPPTGPTHIEDVAFDVPSPREARNEKLILEFKTAQCTYKGNPCQHDVRCCPFFHSEKDRRRPPFVDGSELRYAADPCKEQFDDQGRCYQGDACGYCHNTAELLYHPDIFHKRLCQGKWCPRGKFCAFAHSREDLLVPHFSEIEESELTSHFMMYKFKTLWCPFGEPHNWETCVYAHTYRDWRRVPSLGYCSRPCPAWGHSLSQGSDLAYADRCRFGMSCPCAHGAKEQLYHPDFYKTSPCDNPRCTKRMPLCAFTHGSGDVRMKPSNQVSQRRSGIVGADEFLREEQPTFEDPPKYLSLEEAAQCTNCVQPMDLYDMQMEALASDGCRMCTPYSTSSDMLSTRPVQSFEAAYLASLMSEVPELPNGMEHASCYYAPVLVLQYAGYYYTPVVVLPDSAP